MTKQNQTVQQFVRSELRDLETPLTKGVGKELRQMIVNKGRELGFHRKELTTQLHYFFASPRYLLSIIHNGHRFDLEGNKAEAITDDEKKHARYLLREIRRRRKARQEHEAKAKAKNDEK